jgi:hypothetical protein
VSTPAAEPAPPLPPIRMAQAMRVARRIYVRNLWQVVLLYAVIMAVPTALNVPVANNFLVAPTMDEFFKQMEPGSPSYLPFAFNGMLTALLYPLAATATIVLLRNVIVTRHAHFRSCFREVLRLWLIITQFGLLWYVVYRLCSQAFGALAPFVQGESTPQVILRAGLLVLAVALSALWFFAYVASLVRIVVDRCDPVRAAISGSKLALRHMRGFFAIAWRVTLAYAVYAVAVAVAFAKDETYYSYSVMLIIVPSLIVTPFLVLALALYLLDRVHREETLVAPAPAVPRPVHAPEDLTG